jgi:hypothetical protein
MKKAFLVILLAVLVLPCLASAEGPAGDDAKFLQSVAPVIDNLFAALKARDYKRMTKDFSDEMMKELPPEKLAQPFAAIEKNFGDFVSQSYSKMEKPATYIQLSYVLKYSKGSDMVMQVTFSVDDPAHKIAGLFLSPAETAKRATKEESDAIMKAVKPIVEDYFAALKTKDYARMTKNFSDDLRKELTPEQLKAELDKEAGSLSGPFESAEFDRVETDKMFINVYYVAKYGKTSKTTMKFIFPKDDATHKIVGLWENPL